MTDDHDLRLRLLGWVQAHTILRRGDMLTVSDSEAVEGLLAVVGQSSLVRDEVPPEVVGQIKAIVESAQREAPRPIRQPDRVNYALEQFHHLVDMIIDPSNEDGYPPEEEWDLGELTHQRDRWRKEATDWAMIVQGLGGF